MDKSDEEAEAKRVARVTLLLLGLEYWGGRWDELENKRRRGIYRRCCVRLLGSHVDRGVMMYAGSKLYG